MEVFYCKECEEWFNYDDGVFTPVEREATRFEPKEYSDTDHCIKCGSPVESDCVIDNVVEFLNKKQIRI